MIATLMGAAYMHHNVDDATDLVLARLGFSLLDCHTSAAQRQCSSLLEVQDVLRVGTCWVGQDLNLTHSPDLRCDDAAAEHGAWSMPGVGCPGCGRERHPQRWGSSRNVPVCTQTRTGGHYVRICMTRLVHAIDAWDQQAGLEQTCVMRAGERYDRLLLTGWGRRQGSRTAKKNMCAGIKKVFTSGNLRNTIQCTMSGQGRSCPETLPWPLTAGQTDIEGDQSCKELLMKSERGTLQSLGIVSCWHRSRGHLTIHFGGYIHEFALNTMDSHSS